MSENVNAVEFWILVDPVQDYEETLKIMGVYRSRVSAVKAVPRMRADAQFRNGYDGQGRYLEVQHWRDETLVASIQIDDPVAESEDDDDE